MAKMQYSDEQLFEIGKTNYERLALHCQTLEVSGFWDQARQVMKQSSTEVLDVYVQSVLMKLAVHCGDVLESQLAFIRNVPISNPLGIEEETVIDDDLMRDIDKMYHMPPILIQLCSLYDKENNDDMTEYFLDALLNILICMSYLNSGKNDKINEFVQKYYNKISYYVGDKNAVEHSRYIFRKLSSDRIECDVEKKESVREEMQEAVGEKEADLKEKEGEEELREQEETVEARSREEQEVDEVLSEEEQTWGEELLEWVDVEEILPEEEEESQETVFVQTEEEESSETDFAQREEEESSETVLVQTEEEKELHTGKDKQTAALLASDNAQCEEKTKEQQEEELSEQARAQFMVVKQRIQAREQAEAKAHEARIQELMGELNSLVGLENVKQEIQSLINLIKIRKMRQQMNLPEMDMSYHMVFTGSPGTGKTTVARLVAKIYKELGILSEGNLVETDRSGLVAGYVGQTAIKVHEIVEQAIGGILFIDEAYSLANPEIQNDFGTEAVDALVKLMEDHRDNLVIIVAGYTEEMQSFLKSNTGLISRFNKFIDFPDYSKKELVSIMDVMAQKAGLQIEEAAQTKVLSMLERKKKEEWKDFGNARGIRNLFEKFIMNQANRLVLLEEPTMEDLITIKKEDVAV